MEELLNKLIQMWWNVFWREKKSDEQYEYYKDEKTFYFFWNYDKYGVPQNIKRYSLRELVSKESGLWQFVCDKWLVGMYEWRYWQNIFPLDSKEYDYTDYQYWILESSLIDVDKLEKFLIDNIEIWNGD